MVTISKNQNVEQAFDYYAKENNYQENSSRGHIFGSGLKFLKIKNSQELEREKFYFLLHGVNPATKEKLVYNAYSSNRRAGIDVTTSPPKSFSLLVEKLQANNEYEVADKLLDAHASANEKMMQNIESTFLKTRITKKKKTVKIKTKAFVYASFLHDCSREFDPQFHTHNFIFNLTFYVDEDEKLKILSLSNEEIYKNKMYLGQHYRSELNRSLLKLGYETFVSDEKHGFFEIKGISKEQRELFSSRKITIEADISEKLSDLKEILPNANIHKLKEYIKLKSRPIKHKINRDFLRNVNNKHLEEAGITLSLVLSLKGEGLKIIIDDKIVKESIKDAVRNLSKYKSLFSKEELLGEVLKVSLKYGFIENDFKEKLFMCDNLMKLDNNLYSSHNIIQIEKFVLLNICKVVMPIDKGIEKVLEFCKINNIFLTEFQQKMTRDILTTDRRFIAISKREQRGKRFILDMLRNLYSDVYKFYIFQADENYDTLIKECLDKKEDEKQKVICILGSETISSFKFAKLIKWTKDNNHRMIFLGKQEQSSFFNSIGNMFAQAQNFRMGKEYASKNKYQSTDIEALQERLELLEKEGCLVELEKSALFKKVLENHLKNTTIMVTTREDYRKLNRAIKHYRELWGDFFDLLEKYESFDNKYNTKEYVKNSVLILLDIPSFRKSERVTVQKVIDDKKIVVKTRDNKLKVLDISKCASQIELYLFTKKMLYEKEDIVFTRTIQDRKSSLRVSNGTVATVLKIVGNNITIELNHGRVKTFDIKEIPFVDYAFTVMDFSPKKRPVATVVVADVHEQSLPLLHRHLLKTKSNVLIYTTDIKKLKQSIEELKKIQSAPHILMPNRLIHKNNYKDRNEHRNNAKTEPNREKPDGLYEEANRDREEHQWDIYDIG